MQVESRHDQSVRAQPGFSGSPVFNDETAEAVGLLQSAAFADDKWSDAYLIRPRTIAEAWQEPFDYLLVPPNPYRGLEPFTADDRSVFFGRDTEIQELARRVTAQPVVIIVGPSGVGKSSLVQSGLLPALSDSNWSKVIIRPGLDPWLRLARGLLRLQQGDGSEPSSDDIWREVERLRLDGLESHFRMARSDNRKLIVVIDQFEEVLTTGQSLDQQLLDLLIPTPEAADDAGRIVLTLRADFQPVLQAIPGFAARLNERLYLLSPLAEA
ncbi:MAG: ATP-binding protein, partial [Acidobacteria bacterium]|nr:ATP-binding protein [Acidobacteriota bacterium]